MVNPEQTQLEQLKDIHLPEAVGWWPLAAGWYLLMFLCLTLTFITVFFLWHRYIRTLSKKQALRLLQTYKTQHQQDGNSQLASARVSELLKRVALVYFPRSEAAGLKGDSWVRFLNETAKNVDFKPVRYELLELPFAPSEPITAARHQMDDLFDAAHHWIKQRRKPCLN